MKIGIFDSGLGGLFILKSIVKHLPSYSYLYLGDTKRVPYGNRSQETIYEFTKQAVNYLYKQDCKLIIIACNTASSSALRKIQQEFLPKYFPDKKVLGVIIPTVEKAVKNKSVTRIGILATKATVTSHAYVKELKKLNPSLFIYQNPAPLLVPLIENNEIQNCESVLREYLKPLMEKHIESLILGCTHYPILRTQIQNIIGSNVKLISQDKVIPQKLADYLTRHPEIEATLEKNSQINICATEITSHFEHLIQMWFDKELPITQVFLKPFDYSNNWKN